MSWPLASFLVVGVVLAIGWLAYERARPSARMVAVVATLVAVAALGRDAFVAVPDVKPITAITLVVGYALGPLAGFSVGALGMLTSNFLLGQGPYTPWQMAAWGLVGLAGAALGTLSGRRLGRVQLALACAFTAFVAKEIMNVYTWTIGATMRRRRRQTSPWLTNRPSPSSGSSDLRWPGLLRSKLSLWVLNANCTDSGVLHRNTSRAKSLIDMNS